MTFAEFSARAHEMYDSIPEQYREGVDGLIVERGAVPHPNLPDIYTLGECRTEHYPSDYGGPGEVRSFVVLHYGSFVRLSELDDEWDWEEELWETITHEVRHHLESLAAEDALEVEDYVMDQNFARREGERFDPGFYQDGIVVADGVYEVDGDVFIEVTVTDRDLAAGSVSARWKDREVTVPLPERLSEVHFLTVEDFPAETDEVILVLRRRQGFWASLLGALRAGGAEPAQSRVRLDAAG